MRQERKHSVTIKLIGQSIMTFFLLVSNIFGQTRSDGATPKMTQPGAPAGSYSLSGFENVNLFNGNLNFNVPLAQIGGRGGAGSSINLAIDSARWEVEMDELSQMSIHTPENGTAADLSQFFSTYCYHNWTCNENVCNTSGGGRIINCCSMDSTTCTTSQTSVINRVLIAPTVQFNGPNALGLNYTIRENLRYFNPGYGPGILERRPGKFGGYIPNGSNYERFLSLDRFYFITSDGTEYELRDELTGGKPTLRTGLENIQRGSVFKSYDGNGLRFVSDSPVVDYHSQTQFLPHPSGMLYFPNGSKYRIDNGKVTWIRDVNGNQLNYTYTSSQMTVVDSLGRQTIVTYNNSSNEPNTTYDTISSQISPTEWQTVKVFRTNLGNVLRGDFQLLTKPQMFTEVPQLPDTSVYNPGGVIKRVELPDGRSYKLFYNPYQELARVELPTGSAIEYDFPMPTTQNPPPSNWNGTVFRPIQERRIYENGGSIVTNSSFQSKQKYIRPGATNPPTYGYRVVVEEYSGNQDGESSQLFSKTDHYFHGVPNEIEHRFYGDWKTGREFKTEMFDKNNILRQRTETEWENFGTTPWGDATVGQKVRVKEATSTTFEGGQSLTTKTEYGYDNNSITNNRTDEWIRDYGANGTPGRILKHSQTSYLKVNPVNGLDYTSDGIYLHSLVEWSKLFDVKPDGSEEMLTHTETKYDESNYPILTYSGSVTGWTDPNTTSRGNPTTVRIWNSDENTWIETHAQFDQFGNLRKAWDESGDATRFVETEYSVDYQYAYPTKVITPALDPSGTYGTDEGSFVTTTYNFYTGQTLTVTNEFGQTTATEYNDVLLRPTRTYAVNFAAPETQIVYGDTIGNLFVKVRKQIDATNWDESTSFMDRLGRTTKTQTTDSQGDVFAETFYDNLGRVKRSSNPYREGDTKYWNRPHYDELSRVIETCAPMTLTEINASPSGPCPTGKSLGITSFSFSTVTNFVGVVITSTDASQRKSRSITNALGQLIRIDEATATGGTIDADLGTLANPNQPTFYTYNAQGKMVKVQQGIQNRYFKYDSLGRLIRVRQPEQEANDNLDLADFYNPSGKWSASFNYDALGNLRRATDANGVNIINEYDKAKRPIKRCYTKPNISTTATSCASLSSTQLSENTPTVNYLYDGFMEVSQPPTASPNYAKGKLTRVSSSVSETRYTQFDYLGRLLQMQQITDGQTFTSSYQYNLSGAVVQETYPSGRVVKNEFESDGDLSRIWGKANSNAAERTYANSFSYTADGKIEKLKLGNNRWEWAKFNERLQVTELNLGMGVTDASLWKLTYEYGELQSNGTVDTTKNTGNIARQTISFNGLTQPFVQTYKYDSLYRLTEAKEVNGTGTTPTQNWKQQFSYDRYGNRLTHDKYSGTTLLTQDHKTHPTIDPNTNRFNQNQGYSYDKNGNLIGDAEGRSFVFNGENKQSQIVKNGNLVGEYFYDGEGKRIKKFVYDSNGALQETTVFVYSSGKLVAEYSTATPPPNPTTKWTATDMLESPRVITDTSGQVISRRDFLPFGEEVANNIGNRSESEKYGTTDGIRQRFTGYQKDNETGLDFAQARMYENQHGRFTAVDPLLASGKSENPQSFNRYVYCLNNPLAYTDPTGLQVADQTGRVYYNPNYGFKIFKNGKVEEGFEEFNGEETFDHKDGYRYHVWANGWKSLGKTEDIISDLEAAKIGLKNFVNRPFTRNAPLCFDGTSCANPNVLRLPSFYEAFGWKPFGDEETQTITNRDWLIATGSEIVADISVNTIATGGVGTVRGVANGSVRLSFNGMRSGTRDFLFGKFFLGNVEKQSGVYDIFAHGTKTGNNIIVNGNKVGGTTFGGLLSNTSYNGEKIRLFCCYAGSKTGGFAQKLADQVDNEVFGATNAINARASGSWSITSGGMMRRFSPRPKKEE